MTDLKIAVGIGAAASGAERDWSEVVRFAVESERLGVDFCWSAEAWGQDAVAPLAYLAARTERMRLGTGIMQISARVPSMAAMTAMTMAAISGDRFVLGLGVSGPQVVEGLQGVAFRQPLGRLTEYLDILELAFAGRPLDYQGSHYVLPRPGGEGKVLRLAQRAEQKIPVYLATLGPRGLELTGARADGWVGTCFIPEASAAYTEPMRRGAEQAGRGLADLDLQAGGPVKFGDDIGALLAEVKRTVAFQLGAMGSPKHNFYNRAYQLRPDQRRTRAACARGPQPAGRLRGRGAPGPGAVAGRPARRGDRGGAGRHGQALVVRRHRGHGPRPGPGVPRGRHHHGPGLARRPDRRREAGDVAAVRAAGARAGQR